METKSRPITATSGHLGQLRIDLFGSVVAVAF